MPSKRSDFIDEIMAARDGDRGPQPVTEGDLVIVRGFNNAGEKSLISNPFKANRRSRLFGFKYLVVVADFAEQFVKNGVYSGDGTYHDCTLPHETLVRPISRLPTLEMIEADGLRPSAKVQAIINRRDGLMTDGQRFESMMQSIADRHPWPSS